MGQGHRAALLEIPSGCHGSHAVPCSGETHSREARVDIHLGVPLGGPPGWPPIYMVLVGLSITDFYRFFGLSWET